MTAKKWEQLTPEQQQIKVADLAGKRECNCADWGMMDHLSNCPASWQQEKNLPDYLHDLNAMHEAEKSIPLVKLECYWCHLVRICSHPKLMLVGVEHGSVAIRATAAQRAEAFVLTMEPEGEL
jgi:hypothetical protein